MNRPPKKNKQSKEHLLRDPRFDQKTLEHAHGALDDAAGDDRNLVSIDDAMVDAEFADKLWLFWNRNRTAIVGLVAVVVIATLGYFGLQYYRGHSERQMQNAYNEAQGKPAELEAFAASHASSSLGGVAFLSLADQAYTAGDYSRAADLYSKSQAGLTDTVLLGRAQLGNAISLWQAGQTDVARKALDAVVENVNLLSAVRGQAAFNLIVLELGEGRIDAAKAWLKRLDEIPGAGMEIWANQASSYAAQIGVSLL